MRWQQENNRLVEGEAEVELLHSTRRERVVARLHVTNMLNIHNITKGDTYTTESEVRSYGDQIVYVWDWKRGGERTELFGRKATHRALKCRLATSRNFFIGHEGFFATCGSFARSGSGGESLNGY
ncbi:hypothetical protein NPIL_216091 [Nephila pilipes]|uniref:Uncharacterized protein n=1 Tax=Nephila pilipes TaxID=299642 RepID=A0A8X6NFL3_NEPPI|nr:hypothetical protein NPIL_216091 [Nephila pilipes]